MTELHPPPHNIIVPLPNPSGSYFLFRAPHPPENSPTLLGKALGKAHDWPVDQITDLFHTTQKVKTQSTLWGHRASGIPSHGGGSGAFGAGSPHNS